MIIKNDTFDEAIERIPDDDLTVDVETTGLDVWGDARICGIGVHAPSSDESFYFPYRHQNSDSMPMLRFFEDNLNLSIQTMPRLMRRLEKAQIITGHNLKFDLAALKQDGFEVQAHQTLHETITLARLYFPEKHEPLNLQSVSTKLLKLDEKWKSQFQEYLKKNGIKNQFDRGAPEIVGEYCERDARNTSKIKKIMIQKIYQTEQDRVWLQETQLLKCLWEMEQTGLYFDRQYLEDKIPLLENKLKNLEAEIYQILGKKFDILSNAQLGKALEEYGLTSPSMTPTGKPKWGSAELLHFSDERVCSLLLDFRGIEKMLGTYFLPLRSQKTDYVHASILPWGAVTGRKACRNPNLQNLTKKSINVSDDEQEENEEMMAAVKAMLGVGSEKSVSTGKSFSGLAGFSESDEKVEMNVSVRRLYTHPKDFKFYAIDYSQMEMRIFADYIEDAMLTASLESGEFDFHSHVAKQVWNAKEDSDLWKFYRTLAKNINFGLIYGIGDAKLAAGISKTLEEAKKYKADYFAKFPTALKFMTKVQQIVQSRGWIKNRFGRRYTIDKEKAYQGVNYLVQGTSADIVKNRMVAVSEYLREEQCLSKMIVPVHDEIIYYVHHSEEKELVPKLKELMEVRCISTFLPVDVARGNSWADKKETCVVCFEFIKECNCGNK